MAKAKQKKTESAESFEEALEELQQIVNDLEEGTLGLEESMQRFEKGIALLRRCYQTLEGAEQQIQILTGVDAEGNPLTAPFDATSTIEQSKQNAGRRGSKKKQTKKPPAETEADEDDDSEGVLF